MRHFPFTSIGIASLAAAFCLPLQAAQQALDFDLPAAPLASTLLNIGQQSGLQVLFTQGDVAGHLAPRLRGRFQADQAIERSLQGSGLQLRVTASGALVVEPAGGLTLPATSIDARQGGYSGQVEGDQGFIARRAATASKTDTPLLETPQSISVVSREQMDAQGSQNLTDALRYSAGVAAGYYGDDSRYDWLTVRGFNMSSLGLFRDGLRTSSNSMFGRADSYGLERVEILKGPASVLYGQNAPGGMINLVTKRPQEQALHEVELGYGSYDNKQLRLDLGDALDEQRQLLGRVTLNLRDSQTQVDHIDNDHLYVAPALTWRNDDTQLTLLSSYQHDRSSWGIWLPTQGSLVSGPTGHLHHNFYAGDPDFNSFERDQYTLGYQLEHRFNDTWLARQSLRADTGRYAAKAVRNRGWVDADSSTLLYRDAGIYKFDSDVYSLDNQVQADFSTPGVQYTTLLGADYTWQRTNNRQFSGLTSQLDVADPGAAAATPRPGSPYKRIIEVRQAGVYAQQQVKIDEHWVARIGVRHDQATSEVDVDNAGRQVGGSRDYAATTWQGGVLYLFDNGLAPYYSYAESFLPGTTNSASGQPYKATEGTSHELGIKYQPPGSEMLLTAALFDIRQKNMVTVDPVDSTLMTQTGEVRSRGLELEGKYSPLPGLNLMAGYTYLDARVTKDNVPGKEGTRFVDNWGTTNPRHQASLWADFTHRQGQFKGLGYGMGARYTSARPDYNDDYSQVRETPGYTIVDALLHYSWDEHWKLQLNVDNLMNKNYVANNCYYLDTCYYGAQRTFLATARYRW